MNIDQIQQQWAGLASGIRDIDPVGLAKSLSCKSSAQDRLWRRYKRMCLMALAFAFVLFPMMLHLWPWPLALAFSLYALTASAMDYYLWQGVKAINIVEMPVAEVARLAARCRRLHHRFMAVLVPIAVGLVIALGATVIDDKYALLGMAAGGAFGLSFGLITYLRMMREYKSLTEE